MLHQLSSLNEWWLNKTGMIWSTLSLGIWTQIMNGLHKHHLWFILLDEGWKYRFVFLLQQNLISIQRQKSEVMAATASFYDSFLDVIEFRVTGSTLIHQKHYTQTRTRSCSCFGFYLTPWHMQKILFDLKDNRFIPNISCSCITVFPSTSCHICLFLWSTCTMNSVLIPCKYVNLEKSSDYVNTLASCISNECAAPPVLSPVSVLLLGPCVRAAQHHRRLPVLLWYCKH